MFLFDLFLVPLMSLMLFVCLLALLARHVGFRVAMGVLALGIVSLGVTATVLTVHVRQDLAAPCDLGTVSTGHSSWPQCAATTR